MTGTPHHALDIDDCAPSSVRLVCYGTSLTAERTWRMWRRCGGAWVSLLRRELTRPERASAEVINAARWGATSTWGLAALADRVLPLRPDLVILEFAINDADRRNRISTDTSRENLAKMIARLRDASPGVTVVVTTTNPVWGRHAAIRPALEQYYAGYREVAAAFRAPLIDLEVAWRIALGAGARIERLVPDGLHPNTEACRSVILPTLLTTLSKCLARPARVRS